MRQAYSLAVPRDEALAVRDEVAFFQAVKAALVKTVRFVGEDRDVRLREPGRLEDVDHLTGRDRAREDLPDRVIELLLGSLERVAVPVVNAV
jgi:hypothetical protein